MNAPNRRTWNSKRSNSNSHDDSPSFVIPSSNDTEAVVFPTASSSSSEHSFKLRRRRTRRYPPATTQQERKQRLRTGLVVVLTGLLILYNLNPFHGSTQESKRNNHNNNTRLSHLRTKLGLYPRKAPIAPSVLTPTVTNTTTTKAPPKTPRIAILLPFLSSDALIFPPHAAIFLQTAGGSASLVDFIILHNGELTPLMSTRNGRSYIADVPIPPNVLFISLNSMSEFTCYFLRIIDPSILRKDYKQLQKRMMQLLTKYPYLLVEFKPALAHIFEEFLPSHVYTHWGYSDLDVAWGDLPSWITMDELTNYDIFTYGFGDQERVYLRGQFTILKHTLQLNQLWRQCPTLAHWETRKSPLRHVESAEGCFSHVVLHSSDLKVKYATKAMSDVTEAQMDGNRTLLDTFGMVLFRPRAQTSILFQPTSMVRYNQEEDPYELDTTWTHTLWSNLTLQWEVGDEEDWEVVSFPSWSSSSQEEPRLGRGSKCMYWVPPEYQSSLCVQGVSSTDTLILIHGTLWKRPFQEMDFPKGVKSKALFHFQNWKRRFFSEDVGVFRSNWITTLLEEMRVDDHGSVGWVLFPEGGVFLPIRRERERSQELVKTFQKLEPMDGLEERLPHRKICLKQNTDARSNRCDWALSWGQHDDEFQIFSNYDDASAEIHFQFDITMVLTFDFKKSQGDNNEQSMERKLSFIESNIAKWGTDPIVAVFDLSSSGASIYNFFIEHIAHITEREGPTLIGVIYSKATGIMTSDKGKLSDMAEAASLTRWTVSGLNIEDGIILSSETNFFAKRAAVTYENIPGSLFIIPHLDHRFLEGEDITIMQALSIYNGWHPREGFRSPELESPGSEMIRMWLGKTREELQQSKVMKTDYSKELSFGYTELIIRVTQEAYSRPILGEKESISLMVDAFGPNFIPTQPAVPALHDVSCQKCDFTLSLWRLVILRYSILPLSGAFATTLKNNQNIDETQCILNACFHSIHRASYSGTDIKRISKFATMTALSGNS